MLCRDAAPQELTHGCAARQIGGSGRGVQRQALAGDDTHAEAARQIPGLMQI